MNNTEIAASRSTQLMDMPEVANRYSIECVPDVYPAPVTLVAMDTGSPAARYGQFSVYGKFGEVQVCSDAGRACAFNCRNSQCTARCLDRPADRPKRIGWTSAVGSVASVFGNEKRIQSLIDPRWGARDMAADMIGQTSIYVTLESILRPIGLEVMTKRQVA
jgi:hypothetical protein